MVWNPATWGSIKGSFQTLMRYMARSLMEGMSMAMPTRATPPAIPRPNHLRLAPPTKMRMTPRAMIRMVADRWGSKTMSPA